MSYEDLDDIELENNSNSGRFSETSSNYVKMEVDRIYIELSEIDKNNARIKKELQKFGSLENNERKEARSLLQKNLKNSQTLQTRIQTVPDDNQRLKFENILGKKLKELEVLSQSIVYKEKELLVKYKDQLEENDLEENTGFYEKKGLLDEVSDDDEDEDYFPSNKVKKLNYSSDGDNEDTYDVNLDSQEQLQVQKPEQEVEEFKLDSHEDFLKQRTDKISKVNNSLHKIHKMYTTLNEIVLEQGETLNKIEDNFATTKQNTKKTVEELHKTLRNEKTIRERLCGCDFSIMCLSIWFIVAVVFFGLDLMIARND